MKKLLCILLIIVISVCVTACNIQEELGQKVEELTGAYTKSDNSNPEAVNSETLSSQNYERYAYEHVSDEVRQVYDEILKCMLKQEESVIVSTLDEMILDNAFDAVFSDYGNIFWVEGYSYNNYFLLDKKTRMEFVPNYTMDRTERDRIQTEIDAVVSDWLSGISITDDDYDKAVYVFENLVSRVDYDLSSTDNQNIISAFINKKTVCKGYSCAAWYLLDTLGIKNTIISGTADGENHAWNMVFLDGAYYYMDVTWGNSKYRNSTESIKRINYAYMATTTEELMQTHSSETVFELPECVNMHDNYFVRNNMYVDSWSAEAVGEMIKNAYENGSDCDIKFSNTELLKQAVDYFFTEANIKYYAPNETSFEYVVDNRMNTISILNR